MQREIRQNDSAYAFFRSLLRCEAGDLLFDGLGTDALEYHLPEDSFLRRHQISRISSVLEKAWAEACP